MNIKDMLKLKEEFNKSIYNEAITSSLLKKKKNYFDLKSELEKAADAADNELKNKKAISTEYDGWDSKGSDFKNQEFADKTIVGRRIKGTYGTSYNPDDEDDVEKKVKKDTGNTRRGRPKGSLGAAKRGLGTQSSIDASKKLADLLGIKLNRQLHVKKPTIKHKISDIDTSGIKIESTDLKEMSFMPTNQAALLIKKYSLGLDPENEEHQKTIAGRIRKALGKSRVIVSGKDLLAVE